MELKRVVVTGMGAVTPLGNTTEETWKNLIEGVSGAGPITHFDASLFKTQFACEVKDFNVGDYIDRKEARRMDLVHPICFGCSQNGCRRFRHGFGSCEQRPYRCSLRGGNRWNPHF